MPESDLHVTTLFSSLPVDSLEFMQLVQDVENEFHVTIEPAEIAELHAVGDLCRLVERKLPEVVTLSENAKHGLPE